VPLWAPQYQTFVVVSVKLLTAMYGERRLHTEVAPLMVELGRTVAVLLKGPECCGETLDGERCRYHRGEG